MREKVSTAYFLDDPRKFSSMEEAEKELNRLRAVCVRLKKKQGEDIAFKVVAVLDDPKASVNARLRATELIFNYASRYADSRDILSRMERLEDSLNAE